MQALAPAPVATSGTASGLAMLLAAAGCGALLTADVGRAGAPDLLRPGLPWATWVTMPHFPASAAAGVLDVRPAGWRNGLWSLGRPVVRCGGRTFAAIRQDVSLGLSGRSRPEPVVSPINPAALLDRLRRRA